MRVSNKIKVPFAECGIWECQRNFYRQEKIEAWKNKVPFYATSNPYIAHSYAQVIVRYIQDTIRQETYDAKAPFYIAELGAGSGLFSFYLLKSLLELLGDLGLGAVKIVYVMTDFVEDNITFWQTQPNLQSYVKQGYLDFALYDAERSTSICLRNSKSKLTQDTLKNPLIVIANYVFDSLRHDFFQIANHKLQIGLVNEELAVKTCGNNQSIYLKTLDPDFTYQDTALPYYKTESIDGVLSHFQTIYEGSQFNFPIGVFSLLERLRRLTHDKMLLLVTDKGYAKHIEEYRFYQPEITLHNEAFSITVNLYAIGQYAKNCGGDYFFQETVQGITTAAFTFGNTLTQLVETKTAAKSYLNTFGPGHLLNFYGHITSSNNPGSLETILSYLHCAKWDVHIFSYCLPVIIKLCRQSSSLAIQDLIEGMAKIADNFYYMPGMPNILFKIALFLQSMGQYELAIQYYQQSQQYFGNLASTLCNLGLCYSHLQNYDEAKSCFKKAAEQEQDNLLIDGWLDYLESAAA